MPKNIPFVKGYSLQFDQRAPGEETPYWQGTIFNNGVKAGYFSNDGRGGMTLVMPEKVQEDFRQIVLEESKRQGYAPALFEAEGLVVEFADLRGYKKSWKTGTTEQMFSHFIKEVIKDNTDFKKLMEKGS